VGADYAGVDLMRDADGRWLVLEVNSIPAWRGLQAVTPFRIADVLARDLVTPPSGTGPGPTSGPARHSMSESGGSKKEKESATT